MKMPRTIKILRFLSATIKAVLKDEPFLVDNNLKQLDDLGGVYIKFLQMVVMQLDPKQQENFTNLLDVYEHSKPEPIDVQAFLKKYSPQTLRGLELLESRPFATGSFGQVYKAQLLNGQETVVKILRPNVSKYLHYDLRLLNVVTWLYALADKQKIINFRTIYREFKKTCIEETNYRREAEIASYYHDIYKHHAQIVIPRTYKELCSDRVIVQERIIGLSVADLYAKQVAGVDPRMYVREHLASDLDSQFYVIGTEMLRRAVTGELIQADPHPGNIILLPYNKVALIDFGMVTTIKQNRLAFYELLQQYGKFYSNTLAIEDFAMAALKCLSPQLYEAIAKADSILGTDGAQPLLSKLRQTTRDVADDGTTQPLIKSLLDQRRIMKALFFAINRNNRFGFNFDLQSVNFLKAVQSYLVVVGRFHGQHVVGQVINDVVFELQNRLDEVIDNQETILEPTEALEVLSNWFDKMARNDPWLMQKVAEGYLR